jgi:uncharacterized repeat protein (TIGR03843 family)
MPAHSWQPGLPDILDVLNEARVQEEWMLAAGSNYVFLLQMEHPVAGEGYAVYKPRQGEAPLHDFPSGTLYKREYAAYLVSEALGWGLVPPTVVREEGLRAGIGVLQLFVVHDPALHFFNIKEGRDDDMRRIALFDWLVNNADRKGGHTLVDAAGRLWCIDHGITFHAEDKLRTVIWDYQGTPVPPALVEDVCDFATRLREDAALRAELSELLSEAELRRLEERAALIDRERVYPSPPMYRPYPWPMI